MGAGGAMGQKRHPRDGFLGAFLAHSPHTWVRWFTADGARAVMGFHKPPQGCVDVPPGPKTKTHVKGMYKHIAVFWRARLCSPAIQSARCYKSAGNYSLHVVVLKGVGVGTGGVTEITHQSFLCQGQDN